MDVREKGPIPENSLVKLSWARGLHLGCPRCGDNIARASGGFGLWIIGKMIMLECASGNCRERYDGRGRGTVVEILSRNPAQNTYTKRATNARTEDK